MDRSQGVRPRVSRLCTILMISEAELLHHYITTAAQNPPQATSQFNQNFQLGGGQAQQPQQVVSGDIAPDQSSASSGKVPGTAL
jgi:hypothetical protein